MLYKALYVIVRDLSVFSLPGLRSFRNLIYSRHLKVLNINVDRGVRVQPLHYRSGRKQSIGINLHIGANCLIDLSGSVIIGDRVTLSEGSKIFTHSHPIDYGLQDWRRNPLHFTEIEIGSDVWIGSNAIILSTVSKIGDGAVIAAGSIVGRNVEANTVVAGVPAKYLRNRILNE